MTVAASCSLLGAGAVPVRRSRSHCRPHDHSARFSRPARGSRLLEAPGVGRTGRVRETEAMDSAQNDASMPPESGPEPWIAEFGRQRRLVSPRTSDFRGGGVVPSGQGLHIAIRQTSRDPTPRGGTKGPHSPHAPAAAETPNSSRSAVSSASTSPGSAGSRGGRTFHQRRSPVARASRPFIAGIGA